MFTDHNRFFGWVHNFKIGEANLFFGDNNKRPPYPPIVINPTVRQVFANWNIADTGLLVTGTMIGALLARRQCKYSVGAPISAEKTLYYLFFNSYLSIAVFLGMQNSFYRLVGLNPNGLNWQEEPEPELKKYDFSSDFVERSFWKHLFEKEKEQ